MALVDFTNPAATAWYQDKVRAPARPGRRRGQDRLRRAGPRRRRLARRQRPRRHAQLVRAAVQPGRLRGAAGGPRRGRGRAVRPLGDRGRAAAAGALGRRQLQLLRVDGRVAARRAVAGPQRLRLLEPRHRRLRGHPGPGGVQALARVRPACPATRRLHGSESYRVPWAFDDGDRGARGVGRRRRPHLHRPQAPAHAVPVPGRPRRPTSTACRSCARCSWSSRATRRSTTSTGSTCSGRTCSSPRSCRPTGEVTYYLPAGRWTSLLTDEVVDGGGWRTETHGFASHAAVGAGGRGPGHRLPRRHPRARLRRRGPRHGLPGRGGAVRRGHAPDHRRGDDVPRRARGGRRRHGDGRAAGRLPGPDRRARAR